MIRARSTTRCGIEPAWIHCSKRTISAFDKTTGRLVRDILPCYQKHAYADSIAGYYISRQRNFPRLFLFFYSRTHRGDKASALASLTNHNFETGHQISPRRILRKK
jgi:hypothetical protein